MWNLNQLANAIHPLIENAPDLERELEGYAETFNSQWHKMMADKLGLPQSEGETHQDLVDDLLELLGCVETDMTIFYRGLADLPLSDGSSEALSIEALRPAYYQELESSTEHRLRHWLGRLTDSGPSARSSGVTTGFTRCFWEGLKPGKTNTGEVSQYLNSWAAH